MKESLSVRAILSYFWSLIAAAAIFYILVEYGKEKEILTLIIGVLSGTILGGIFGVYFSAPHSAARPTAAPAIEKAENVTVNNPGAETSTQTPAVSDGTNLTP